LLGGRKSSSGTPDIHYQPAVCATIREYFIRFADRIQRKSPRIEMGPELSRLEARGVAQDFTVMCLA